jgi:hypothetical protein
MAGVVSRWHCQVAGTVAAARAHPSPPARCSAAAARLLACQCQCQCRCCCRWTGPGLGLGAADPVPGSSRHTHTLAVTRGPGKSPPSPAPSAPLRCALLSPVGVGDCVCAHVCACGLLSVCLCGVPQWNVPSLRGFVPLHVPASPSQCWADGETSDALGHVLQHLPRQRPETHLPSPPSLGQFVHPHCAPIEATCRSTGHNRGLRTHRGEHSTASLRRSVRVHFVSPATAGTPARCSLSPRGLGGIRG